MSTIHAILTPGGDWEINVKQSWQNPPKNFMKQQPFAQKTAGDCETNVKNCLGNTPKNLLGGESHLLQRTQEGKRVISPEDPKANAVGEKCKKELRNWETSLKK